MQTLLLSQFDENTAQIAADYLREGALVALPTETVYGLGANGLNEEAVRNIFIAKGRPQDNPLILHIAEPKDLSLWCREIPESAWALAEKFWPGPLTLVLPAAPQVPKRTTGGLSTVAVRCPQTEITRDIIRRAGVPIAAPSANLSGKPSTTTAAHVLHDYGQDGPLAAIVDGGPCQVGVESTIVDLSGERPRLLRPGGISPEQLREVLGELEVDRAVTAQISADTVVRAPGMKYKHYAPQAQVTIVEGSALAAARYIRARLGPETAVLCFEEELSLYPAGSALAYGRQALPESLSAGLFSALRALDRGDVAQIYARCPSGGGVNYAVQNRLKKAAGFCSVQAPERPFVLGVTGGSGGGKSTLLTEAERRGGLILDCDEIYHDLLKNSQPMLEELKERFPSAFLRGVLERKELGKLVFDDPKALQDLNALTHRYVAREVERCLLETEAPFVLLEAIGLLESGLDRLCSATVAVCAPEDKRLARLMAREGLSLSYALARIRAQKPDSYYETHCTYTLYNDAPNEEAFRQAAGRFLDGLLQEKECSL